MLVPNVTDINLIIKCRLNINYIGIWNILQHLRPSSPLREQAG